MTIINISSCALILGLSLEPAFSFTIPTRNIASPRTSLSYSKSSSSTAFVVRRHDDIHTKLFAKSPKDEDDEDDKRQGMNKAFDELNTLSELDLSDESELDKALEQRKNISSSSSSSSSSTTITEAPEEELKLYGEMYAELNDKGEDQLYDDVLSELTGVDSSSEPKTDKDEAEEKMKKSDRPSSKIKDVEEDEIVETYEDVDNIGGIFTEEDQSEFMDRAIKEAMAEAKEAAPGQLSDSILNDKEMMKEIEKVFDEANKKLLASVEDIRKEQSEMAQSKAVERTELLKKDEARLAEAEGSISRLVDKVNKETLAVEEAIQGLERAKQEMNSTPLSKIAALKDAGIVKQSSFVLALLFSVRSLTDLVLVVGPNSESHAVAAAVQAGIAIVFALIFLL